jgi:hypothetical protein
MYKQLPRSVAGGPCSRCGIVRGRAEPVKSAYGVGFADLRLLTEPPRPGMWQRSEAWTRVGMGRLTLKRHAGQVPQYLPPAWRQRQVLPAVHCQDSGRLERVNPAITSSAAIRMGRRSRALPCVAACTWMRIVVKLRASTAGLKLGAGVGLGSGSGSAIDCCRLFENM